MSNDSVVLFCEQLKLSVGALDPKRASRSLDAIDQLFIDRVSESEIDLAIERVFKEDGGVLGFLKLGLNQCKVFKTENVKSFELLGKIVEFHPQKVKKHATNTIIICLRFIRSEQASAREGEKAVALIEKFVNEKCCDEVDQRYVMNELLRIEKMKKSGIVLNRIYMLIGRFSKDYPDCIESGDGPKIRDMYYKALDKAVTQQQDTSMVSLAGAFDGLNAFLENFGPSEEHKNDFAQRVYNLIKPMARPVEGQAQKNVYRCALRLLAERCELFGAQIFKDFFFWHDLLVNTWLKMDQYKNRQPAQDLLQSIHREIAERLLQNSESDKDWCCEILKFLQQDFKNILQSPTSESWDMRRAIVGFGLLGAPCKKLLQNEDLDELLNLVLQRTKCVANDVNAKPDKEQLQDFPEYVEALSRLMEQTTSLSGVQLNVLREIIISLIRNFHLLSTATHVKTVNTLMKTFDNLLSLGNSILDDVLQKVIYQGVIFTCSHRLPIDASSDWETFADWKAHVTYNSYLPLWNGFLTNTQSQVDRKVVVSKIYDQMMHTLIKLLNKLDLRVSKRIFRDDHGNDQELFFSDPNYDFEPVRVKDFHIFFNLVDFYRAIWKAQSLENHRKNLVTWMNRLVEEIISKSRKYPLVSGFLKLMEVILGIANRLEYFNIDPRENDSSCYNNVYFYLCSIIKKAQQSSGELQIACLKLLFTAPERMLRTMISDMIPVYELAFDIGKSKTSLFLAEMALNSIEKYIQAVQDTKSNETKSFLHAVLPYFDIYLQGFKGDSDETVEISNAKKTGTKRTAQKLTKIRESDLLKFQKRILFFLGTLEPYYCMRLVQDGGAGAVEYTSLVKWSTTQIVRLNLYGQECIPEISMDELIPRLCEIASKTTERQKKVTACEILQATILYLIGSYNHRGRLWTELCQLMLELACDSDLGVKQMFEPLVMQTMHYMSKNDQRQHEGTKILLECLMNAISHPKNLSVRDLASRSLREFLVWTLKHDVTSDRSASSSFNIVTFISQLKMYNSDSLQQRRFGAALAFNNIYRVLREDEAIIDEYWIDLLHDFCINFNLSEEQLEDSLIENLSDLKQVSLALDHIERVLRESKSIFNSSSNKDRKKPIPFSGTLLIDAVLWLFSQCNSIQNLYRKKMMEMFLALAPCIEGYDSSVATLVRSTQKPESLIELCEKGIDYQKLSDKADFETIYTWMQHLHSSLDCYMWFIDNSFILDWKSVLENSKIFGVLQFYLINAMNRNSFRQNSTDNDTLLVIQKEKINTKKSAILLAIFSFLNKAMNIDCVPIAVWEQCELLELVETAVFKPQTLQCDAKNPQFLTKLSEDLKKFIMNTFRCSTISMSFREQLIDKLYDNTIANYERLANSIGDVLNCSSIPPLFEVQLNGIDLVCGLIRAKHMQPSGSLNKIDMLASTCLERVFEGITEERVDTGELLTRSPSPDARKFVGRLLQVCFHKDAIYVDLIDLILNPTELRLFESQQSTIKHGLHFLNSFKSTIFEYFLNNVDIIVGRLISKISSPNLPYILRILNEIIENAYKFESKNLNLMKSLTNLIVNAWPDMMSKSKAATEQNDAKFITTILIELVGQLAMICPYPLEEIAKKEPSLENWLLDIIEQNDPDVEIKTQAIFLLPCVIGPATHQHSDLEKALEHFQKMYFPLNTAELRVGTVERSSYENAFQSILDCMLASKSPLILKYVVNCTATDANHIMEHKIIETVKKFMGGFGLKLEHQLLCLNMVFEMFTNKSLDPTIRTVIMQRFLLNMILSSTKETVVQFYAQHIFTIGDLLDTPYNLAMKDFSLEQAFTSRIGGYELLEVFSAILTRAEICDTKNAVVLAAKEKLKLGDKANALLEWMTKKISKEKTAIFQSHDPKRMEWFRKMQCAAFKSVCALVGNTQKEGTQLKIYESIIFDERNWRNIINTTDSNLYANQSLEVDEKPQIKARLVSIRRENDSTTINGGASSNPHPKYIESQTIFESSLSQDVTKIDLSSSYVRTAEEVNQLSRLANYQPKVLKLERNSVNDHEAMPIVCGIIENMFEYNITPTNEDGTCRRGLPLKWVESLCNLIANKSGTVHINIRIFLATVVDNCSKWFRNYANVLTSAILKFLCDWIDSKEQIDALGIFLIVDLLEWDAVYKINTPDEQQLASNLLTELMKRADSKHRDVFRRNLELIRNLTEKCRDFMRVPYNLMYDNIKDPNIESKSNICGIQLNGIILANNLVPWNDETKQPFIDAILSCLNNTHADVYNPAAQVLGMILNEIIIKQNNGHITEENEILISKISARLKGWKKTNEKKFMYVLNYIDKHYVIKGFLTSILTLASASSADVKKYYLQMLHARVDEAEESRDIEMILLALLDQSNQKEHQHQLIGLHIFNKSLAIDKFSIDQIKHILPLVTAFQDAKQTEIRDLVYEIMKNIREKFGANDETLNIHTTKILLDGLNDVAIEIQNSVFEYWSFHKELPQRLSDRVLYMLQHLYSSDFLTYGVQLLLDLKSKEFTKKLLADRRYDDDTKLTEYDIDVHWKTQDSSLRVPLFTESQQRHIINGEIDPTHSYLRATQNSLMFDPTLDPMTVHKSSDSFPLQSLTSLQFETLPPVLDRRSNLRKLEGGEKAAQPTKLGYLRERILRNKNEISRNKTFYAIQHRNYRKEQETQKRQHKAGQVALYRRYRFGDYPDFFINGLAFLLPLKMLAGLDSVLARNAFVTIVNAVCQTFENQQQKHTFLTELARIFGTIIRQPNNCDSLLFSAVTEILLTNSASLGVSQLAILPSDVNDTMINAILLLEKRLMHSNHGSDEVSWAQLAELYYNLSEFDVASSIFAEKIKSNQLLSTAIEYEANREFKNALKTYTDVINTSADNALADLYSKHVNEYCTEFAFNSAFNCYELMGRWEDLKHQIIDQLSGTDGMIDFEQLWTDEWNKNHLLPYYFRAELRTTLIDAKTSTTKEFLRNVQQWLRNPERANLIKRQFGEQLMMLYIADYGYSEAKVFSNQYFENFLDEWSAMNVLSENVRVHKLMNARRVAEVYKYVDLLNGPINDDSIIKLCDRWMNTHIMQADSTEMWEAIITYRIFITEQALRKRSGKSDSVVGDLIESMFDMQFKLNELALKQQNFELSNSVLKRLDSFKSFYGENTQKSNLHYDLAKICFDRINVRQEQNQSPDVILPDLLRIWADLQGIQKRHAATLNTHPDIQIKLMDQLNEVTNHCRESVSKCSSVDTATEQVIFELTGCMDESRSVSLEIDSFFQRSCYKTIETIEKYEKNRSAAKEQDIGESYYRLAIFCSKHHQSGSNENRFEMSELLIKSVLRGMRFGSKNARLQFPRILQLPAINTMKLTAVFNEEIKHVPLWTFLRSISQIMSRFTFDKPCFLDNLVLCLATEYPSIVVYPFQLSHEYFNERNANDKLQRPLVQRILKAIENPFIQEFIDNLKTLSLPEKVLLHHLHKFAEKGKNSKFDQLQLKAGYENVFNNPLRSKLPPKILTIQKDFIALMNMFEQVDCDGIKAAAKKLYSKLDTDTKATKRKSKEKLSSLNLKLSQYHWYGSMERFLELPGQYTGDAQPNTSTSLKIVKFHEEVSILMSLRMPFKITCTCSDGKLYSFLVKYGEDLRQDERIQHVQELMSEQMQLDKNCSQQKLSLRSYKVIPLNTNCGIINWIENTETIDKFMKIKELKELKDINNAAWNIYYNFINRGQERSGSRENQYIRTVLDHSREEIASNLEKCLEKIPENLLRQALYKLSATPECFFMLRNNFGKSLAVMSITHWLLGIGDRNLGNFLIDMNNGKMIGIDFNMAFGQATQKLNIPELVPFRLTEQFVNALKPLETSGFLIKNMIHVLRTFNLESESLMAALEVFVHEPIADYAEPSDDRISVLSSPSTTSSENAWSPEVHLKTIKDKLSGIDPTIPVVKDISMSGYYSSNADIVLAYTELVNGSPSSYRKRVKKHHMTVEEQVKCLIDIARDPSVLGASYIGFQPWI